MDAEHYRRRARHYLIRARRMISPVNRATMIDMAVIWMRMADWAKAENPLIQQQPQQQVKPQIPSSAATSKTNVFGSKALIGKVFDDVLHTLGLVQEDPITRLVAKKVIELAQAGERDSDRLKRLTLEAFEG
jgi:hypothetical protein